MRKITKIPHGKWTRKYYEDFAADRDEILEEIFKEADKKNISNEQLAVKANLSPSTVYNIASYKTMLPQYSTIWKLAKAVGMKLQLVLEAAKGKKKSKTKLQIRKTG